MLASTTPIQKGCQQGLCNVISLVSTQCAANRVKNVPITQLMIVKIFKSEETFLAINHYMSITVV